MLLVRRLIHQGRERKEISRDNRNEVQVQSVRAKKHSYLKIQATESFEISQKSVHLHTVTNILSFFITIFMFSLL